MGTVTVDADSILTESSAGVYRPDEAGQYLIIASGEFESTHDNRQNIKWIGSRNGADVDGFVGDSYSRHNEADFLNVHAYAILPFNGTTDTFEIDDLRDAGAGTPAGVYNWTHIKLVQLSESTTELPYGHYGTPTSAAHSGSDTYTDVAGWDVITETDTTVIELQVDAINVELKEADRPFLVVYGLANSDSGGSRTGRMSRLQHNTTTIAHSYGGAYQRNNTTQYAGPVGIGLVRPGTANQDLKVQLAGYEWINTVSWGTFNIGSWALSATEAGFMVIALPAATNVAIFEDLTAAQSIQDAGPQDINHALSTVGTADSPFTRDNNTDVTVSSAVNVLAVGTLASERIATSGERGSHGIRWEIEGVDDAETEGYMFVRGDQSTQDHYGNAMRAIFVGLTTANDTFQLERFRKGASENGTNDDTMYAGSFFVDLDSLAASGTDDTATLSAVGIVTGTPAVTVVNNVNAAATLTTVPVTIGIPVVTVVSEVNATVTLAVVPVTVGIPAVVATGEVHAVASLTVIPVTVGVPTVTAVGEIHDTATLTTVPVTVGVPAVVASGGDATATITAVPVTVGVGTVTVSGAVTLEAWGFIPI